MPRIPYPALALLLAACASNEPKMETHAPQPSTPTASAPASPAHPATQAAAGNPLHDPAGVLARRSVYFDFDSNAVKDEYQPLIRAHSAYLASHPQSRARIEGNCDERGNREYNLALGQRRAEAVKRVMTVMGVPAGHLESVSYGEEKPASAGHDESSWAKNRRDDIRYVAE